MTQQLRTPATTNHSVIPAIVTANDDDEAKLGRVKVRFPWMSGQEESGWIHVAAPGAGRQRGFFFVPEVDDLVLVAFAYGRIDRAYVIGSLWSTADRPPVEERFKRTIKSVSGHVITLDDTEDAESITIIDKSGANKIVLDAANNTITIESGGDLMIKAVGRLELSSDDDIAIRGTNISIEATGSAELKGNEVVIEGPSGVNVNNGALEVI